MEMFNLDGREFIELFKVLKIEGLTSSGGEAKAVIAAGQVLVKGVIEPQTRTKMVVGDIREFGNEKICIQLK